MLRVEIKVPENSANPPTAAQAFYTEHCPGSLCSGDFDLMIVRFRPAGHEHRGWRLAAVQDLARAAAPSRVNGIVGDNEQAIAEVIAWLEDAPGVTGQLLAVDPD